MPLTIEIEPQIESRSGEPAAQSGVSAQAATSKPIPADWLAEFEAAARRPLRQRFKYAFIKLDKPVLDDAEPIIVRGKRWKNTANGAKTICPLGWITAANKDGDLQIPASRDAFTRELNLNDVTDHRN